MLIEFIGFPGAGKTTVQRGLLEAGLKAETVVPSRNSFSRPVFETIYRHLRAVLFFLLHPIKGWQLFKLVKETKQASFSSFRAVFINFLYKLSFYSKLNKQSNYMMDEGFVHAVLSIMIGSNNLSFDFSQFLKLAPSKDQWQLVYLKLDPDVALERVFKRNQGTHRLHTLGKEKELAQIVTVFESFLQAAQKDKLAVLSVVDVDGKAPSDVDEIVLNRIITKKLGTS